jgi:hypothetical protein
MADTRPGNLELSLELSAHLPNESEPQNSSTTNGHEGTQIQTEADVFQLLVLIGVHLLAKVFGVRG